MKNLIITPLFVLIFSISSFAVDVALQVDRAEIIEGQSVRATILRGNMDGDLEVSYSVGAPKLEIANVKASAVQGGSLPRLTDGDLKTAWQNAGNSKNEGKDDTPYILITLAEPSILGEIKIANYINNAHEMRCVKDAVIEISLDGENFTEAMQIKCTQSRAGSTAGIFESFAFPKGARATPVQYIRLKILSNYNREFYKGTSYEGDFSNGSIVGVSEIEILGYGVDNATRMPYQSTVNIPNGQSSVSFNVPTTNDPYIYGNRIMEIRINPSASYILPQENRAYINVIDDDFGSQVSVTASKPIADFETGESGEFTFTRTDARGELAVKYTTANIALGFQYIGASSTFHNAPLSNLSDNSLSSSWANGGNASVEGEKDDEPWVVFTFDDIYAIGMMRIANYVNPGHTFRSAKDIEVLVADNENDFISLGIITLKATPGDAKAGIFEDIPLSGLSARRIAFKILSNYSGIEFYKGKSFEGKFANGSYVGLSEVQFFTGSTLNFKDIEEELTNYVVFAPGQDTVKISITPKKMVGDKTVDITLLEDYTLYTVDLDNMNTTVTVK